MTGYSLKLKEINKKWFLVDATDLVVGRLASRIALILRGKNKASYTPFLDCGDNVVIINADKIKLTGKKLSNKKYYRHSGYPGGIKSVTPEKLLSDNKSERIVRSAITGMLGKGPLGRVHAKNLYIYQSSEHPHTGQQPEVIDFKSLNKKNSA